MIYGYIRVSTDKQTVENQRAAILEYANQRRLGEITFKEEIISSTKNDRLIYRLIDSMKDGDSIIVYELSRLGRSMSDINRIISRIQDKNATLRIIIQDLTIQPGKDDITSHTLIFALSIAAQLERDMISERTKSALKARKESGVKLGRPSGKSKLDAHRDAIIDYLDKGLNITAISKLVGCNRQTLANWIDQHKETF